MTAKDVKVLEQASKSIFTSFPVPIMISKSLQTAGTQKPTNGMVEGTDTKVDFTLHNDCNERQDLRCKNAT